jgi:uncharacterized membrane protein YqjE
LRCRRPIETRTVGLNVGAREPGFLEALRDAGATLMEIVSVRAALFGVELREELERRKRSLLLAACATVLLHAALISLTFLVAAIFWDTHRVIAIASVASAYLACAAAILLVLRADSSASAPAFAASLSELQHDLKELRGLR